MSWKDQKNRPSFYQASDPEREELRRLVAERDKKLKPGQMPTIITEKEMADRKRLGMDCTDYITLQDFRKKTHLANASFMLRRKTYQQELDDKKFAEEISELERSKKTKKFSLHFEDYEA